MDKEALKTDLILSREVPKTLAWYSVGVFFVVLAVLSIIYLPPLMKALAHNAEAGARNTESVTGNLASASTRLDNIAKKIEDAVDPILKKVDTATTSLVNTTGTIETNVPGILKNLNGIGAHGGTLLAEGQGALADVRKSTLPAINALLIETKPNVLQTVSSVKDASGSLAHGMKQLDAYISDKKTVDWIDEQMALGHHVALQIDKVSGSAVVMASNGEKITANGVVITEQGAKLTTTVATFVDGYLNTQPKWYSKWILTPLRAVLGYGLTVYQITKK